MSLIQQVTAVIEEIGAGTADDVCRELGWEVDRGRVIRALQNARFSGLLESAGVLPPVKGSRAARLTTYRRAKRNDGPLPAASVWHYAQGVAVQSRRVSSVWDLGSAHGISTRESA
jgi:hypothetical protein